MQRVRGDVRIRTQCPAKIIDEVKQAGSRASICDHRHTEFYRGTRRGYGGSNRSPAAAHRLFETEAASIAAACADQIAGFSIGSLAGSAARPANYALIARTLLGSSSLSDDYVERPSQGVKEHSAERMGSRRACPEETGADVLGTGSICTGVSVSQHYKSHRRGRRDDHRRSGTRPKGVDDVGAAAMTSFPEGLVLVTYFDRLHASLPAPHRQTRWGGEALGGPGKGISPVGAAILQLLVLAPRLAARLRRPFLPITCIACWRGIGRSKRYTLPIKALLNKLHARLELIVGW